MSHVTVQELLSLVTLAEARESRGGLCNRRLFPKLQSKLRATTNLRYVDCVGSTAKLISYSAECCGKKRNVIKALSRHVLVRACFIFIEKKFTSKKYLQSNSLDHRQYHNAYAITCLARVQRCHMVVAPSKDATLAFWVGLSHKSLVYVNRT